MKTDYEAWLDAEVQEAIDDASPTIPHEEVVQLVRAAIAETRNTNVHTPGHS